LSLLNERARRFFVNSTATACKTRKVRPFAFSGRVYPHWKRRSAHPAFVAFCKFARMREAGGGQTLKTNQRMKKVQRP
jgi:hypothetical protein